MPTVPDALGFSNRWYPKGYQHAIDYRMDEQLTIKIFSLSYFLASKIEAFKNRGKNDYRLSSDFEDIVFVLENGINLEEEFNRAPASVKHYLQKEFRRMRNDPYFEEGLYAHLEWKTAEQQWEKISNLLDIFVQA